MRSLREPQLTSCRLQGGGTRVDRRERTPTLAGAMGGGPQSETAFSDLVSTALPFPVSFTPPSAHEAGEGMFSLEGRRPGWAGRRSQGRCANQRTRPRGPQPTEPHRPPGEAKRCQGATPARVRQKAPGGRRHCNYSCLPKTLQSQPHCFISQMRTLRLREARPLWQ